MAGTATSFNIGSMRRTSFSEYLDSANNSKHHGCPVPSMSNNRNSIVPYPSPHPLDMPTKSSSSSAASSSSSTAATMAMNPSYGTYTMVPVSRPVQYPDWLRQDMMNAKLAVPFSQVPPAYALSSQTLAPPPPPPPSTIRNSPWYMHQQLIPVSHPHPMSSSTKPPEHPSMPTATTSMVPVIRSAPPPLSPPPAKLPRIGLDENSPPPSNLDMIGTGPRQRRKSSSARPGDAVRRESVSRPREKSFEIFCSVCGKKYKNQICLQKHSWEHHESWHYAKRLMLNKHQSVQIMEAAQSLINMLTSNTSTAFTNGAGMMKCTLKRASDGGASEDDMSVTGSPASSDSVDIES